MVNPRDIAGERKKKRTTKKPQYLIFWWLTTIPALCTNSTSHITRMRTYLWDNRHMTLQWGDQRSQTATFSVSIIIIIYCAQKETHIFMSLISWNIWSFEIYNNTPQHEHLLLEDTCVMWAANKWLTLSVWVSYNCFTLYGACFSQTVRY